MLPTDLSDLLTSFGFASTEEIAPTCMAADPRKRAWARRVGRVDGSWAVCDSFCEYSWIGITNEKGQLLAKTLCLRIVMPDFSEYNSCVQFPDLISITPGFSFWDFVAKVRAKLQDRLGVKEVAQTVLFYGPHVGTIAESIAVQRPLILGRGTKQGMINWLNSLTQEERNWLSENSQ